MRLHVLLLGLQLATTSTLLSIHQIYTLRIHIVGTILFLYIDRTFAV